MLAKTERLAIFEADLVVTHGDYSLGNVLFEADANGIVRATGMIDVGRLGLADRYQDIAIMAENLAEFGVEAVERWFAALDIRSPDAARLAFHRCLDELF